MFPFPLDTLSQLAVQQTYAANPDFKDTTQLTAFLEQSGWGSEANWKNLGESGYSQYPLMEWDARYGYIPWQGKSTSDVIIWNPESQKWTPVSFTQLKPALASIERNRKLTPGYTYAEIAPHASGRIAITWPFLWETRPQQSLLLQPSPEQQPIGTSSSGLWLLLLPMLWLAFNK
jgi:hypothetical protein